MDNYLDLDAVFKEVKRLFDEYGMECDKDLDGKGQELKKKILGFINKLEEYTRQQLKPEYCVETNTFTLYNKKGKLLKKWRYESIRDDKYGV